MTSVHLDPPEPSVVAGDSTVADTALLIVDNNSGNAVMSTPPSITITTTAGITTTEHNISRPSGKKPRHRKRKREIFRKIREQIAFYFSDSNLRHDKFMRKLTGIDRENPSEGTSEDNSHLTREYLAGTKKVPLLTFLTFNKIATITSNEHDLVNAFRFQPEFTAFETELFYDVHTGNISRREPFFNANVESNARTIYVERFDYTIADIFQWLKAAFEHFGPILSIRTPRYRQSKELMGFAFIEFAGTSSVEKACKYFEQQEAQQKKEKEKTNEEEQQPTTAEEGAAAGKCDDEPVQVNKRKRDHDELDLSEQSSENIPTGAKKVKFALDDEQQQQQASCSGDNESDNDGNKLVPKEVSPSTTCSLSTSEREELVAIQLPDIPQPIKQAFEPLRVMSKQRWNQYKNRYLKLQKNAQATMHTLPCNNAELCRAVLANFDISKPKPNSIAAQMIANNQPLPQPQQPIEQRTQHHRQRHSSKAQSQSYQRHSQHAQQHHQQHHQQHYQSQHQHQQQHYQHQSQHLHHQQHHQQHHHQQPHHQHQQQQQQQQHQAPKRVLNPGTIVQMDLLTTDVQNLDTPKLRKQFRSLFEQEHYDPDNPSTVVPNQSEIAFIDISDKMIQFNPDGSLKQKLFIRAHSLDAAVKLVTPQCQALLRSLLGPEVQVRNVGILGEKEADLYWDKVNNTKRARF